jgi:hypothetical protein
VNDDALMLAALEDEADDELVLPELAVVFESLLHADNPKSATATITAPAARLTETFISKPPLADCACQPRKRSVNKA